MRGKTKLLTALAVLMLLSGRVAYGYWVEELRTAWTVPVIHDVTLEIALPQEEELLPAPVALGAAPESVETPEGKPDLAGQQENPESGSAEAGQSGTPAPALDEGTGLPGGTAEPDAPDGQAPAEVEG